MVPPPMIAMFMFVTSCLPPQSAAVPGNVCVSMKGICALHGLNEMENIWNNFPCFVPNGGGMDLLDGVRAFVAEISNCAFMVR